MIQLCFILIYIVCVLLDADCVRSDCCCALFGLDDLAGATLIGSGLSALSGLFGSSSASSSASANSRAIQYAADKQAEATKYSADQYIAGINATNSLNRQENEAARQFQWSMWDATNRFNDPKNEVSRLLEAGINPIFKDGIPASMQSAPGVIGMQAPDQTAVTDYVSPAIARANVEQQGLAQRNDILNQTFQSISNGLMAASQMENQAKRFGLDMSLSKFQKMATMAQIKSLSTQNLKLSNDMANDDVRIYLQRRESLDNLLTSAIGRKWTEKQIQHLDLQINNWEREFQVALYNAKTGRISANASATNAATSARSLAHEIKKYYTYNLPNWDDLTKIQQNQIMYHTFDNVLSGLKLQNDLNRNEVTPIGEWFNDDFDTWNPNKIKGFFETFNPLRGLFRIGK